LNTLIICASAGGVAQDDREGLSPNEVLGDQDGVAEAERFTLADVRKIDQIGYLPDLGEEILLPACFEKGFELDRDIEMVFNRVLAAARDQDDVVDTGGHGLLDTVLNDWFVDERQHLFGLRLRRREEAGSKAGYRENRFANGLSTAIL
jgi:hypothetical protein